jgi:UDP-3-O-[3-hydroxymyristoyl] glucosamine N-acyltransferase
MPDPRFFTSSGPLALKQVADRAGAQLRDARHAETRVHTVAPLRAPEPGALTFCDHRRYLDALPAWPTESAILVTAEVAAVAQTEAALLITPAPTVAFARMARQFFPEPLPPPTIAPSAVVAPSAEIDPSAVIAAQVSIGHGVKIGARTIIRAGAVIGDGVEVGADCDIGALVSLHYCLIGDRVKMLAGGRIGEPGFGFVTTATGVVKVPQLGLVEIGDDVEIGANACIDRATLTRTVIGQGTMIDNLVHIAHNVQIGKGCIITAQVGISGSTVLEDYVVLGGQVGIADHIRVGRGTRIASRAALFRDVPAGSSLGGFPAVPVREWHRQSAFLLKVGQKKGTGE